MKKILSLNIFVFFFIFLLNEFSVSSEVKIITKVNNQIITNLDIENEKKYLMTLNKNFENLDKDKMYSIALESIIREKIKRNELKKYFLLNQKNINFDNTIVQIYKRLNLDSLNEFKNYLTKNNLNYEEIYKKIEIETLWNQLIYTNYADQVVIQEERLKEEILKNKDTHEMYKFSEIVFDFKNKDEFKRKYDEINNLIIEKGFSEAVLVYSISDSASNSGSLDWVNSNILSNSIKEKIENLNIGEVSDPINIPAGALLLRIDDKKNVEKEIDLEKELQKAKDYELTSQLNNFSLIYYNKIKQDFVINER